MICPFCHAKDTKVVDSRLVGDGSSIRRRRECIHCSNRFTTYETVEYVMPRVVKQDNSFEQFDEPKLKRGMIKSLEKRPVHMEQIDTSVQNIIQRVKSCGEREISSMKIGAWVMDELQKLDKVAYVRFASVYRCFQDVEDFQQELQRLKTKEIEQSHNE